MKTILLGSVAVLLVACGSNGEGDSQISSTELRTEGSGPPSCTGWACSKASVPVSDDDIFAIAARYQGVSESHGSVARLAAIECGSISTNCQPPSCSIRTTCGGGGPIGDASEAAKLDSWLIARGVRVESVGWATRSVAQNIVCRRSGSGARCSFSSSTGGAPGSTSGAPSTSGGSTSPGCSPGSSGTEPGTPGSSGASGSH